MALVNSKSPLTVLSPFELFSNVPTQTSIETIRNEQIRPVSQLNSGGYITFDIKSNIDEYIKLEDIFLYVKFRVKLDKTDQSTIALTDWDNVSMVNNILHSLFNQVDLSINDIQTTISLLTYAHKAYFNDLLFTTSQARANYLQGQGWFTDDEATHYNKRSKIRNRLIEHSCLEKYREDKTNDATLVLPIVTDACMGKIVELSGRIHLDFLQQFKYLIGGTKMSFKFVLNRPEFFFMINDTKLNASIIFEDAYLDVPKVVVSNDIIEAHQQALNLSPAKYPIDRFEVRTQTIDSGVTGKNIEHVINGQLPKKIYVAFIENQAFNGSYTENPYLYQHYNIRNIACFVHGRRIAQETDFENRLCLNSYLELCKITNQANNNFRMGVSKRNFEFGSTIFAFNICQDSTDGFPSSGHVNPPMKGEIRFEITFNKATSKTINALFFCDFDNQVSITAQRDPLVDY